MGKLINLNNKKPFGIKCRDNGSSAEIIIYEDIGQGGFFGEALSAKDFEKELKALPKTVTQIDVRLNSMGGDVFEGITIYNRLKQHSAHITVYVDGMAASIASVIAMAGDEIIMSDGALMLIHSAWTVAGGNARDLEHVIDRLLQIDEQILSIYQNKTRMDKNELRDMISKETTMNADQAIEMGFATKKSQEEFAIAASVSNASWIKNKPNYNRNKIIKDKLSEFKKDVEGFLARK